MYGLISKPSIKASVQLVSIGRSVEVCFVDSKPYNQDHVVQCNKKNQRKPKKNKNIKPILITKHKFIKHKASIKTSSIVLVSTYD